MDEQKRDLTSFTTAISKMIAKNESSYNLTRYGRNRYERVKEYTLEEIKDILDAGSVDAQIILSRNYFERGGFYWRLLMHYATLLKYTGLLIPNPSFGKNLSESYITKKYHSAVSFIDKANLPDLFTHIGTKVLRDGSYYGVIQEVTDKSISILDLPIFYCRSRFKDKEGNDIIEFNVTYFDTIHDGEYRKKALAAYPANVVNWYKRWKARKVKSPWCYISTSVGICMSLIDERPVFLNIIAAELEYEDAKDINKERDLEEIRKILVQHIPHLTDGGLLFEPEEAVEMHKGAVDMMKKNENLSVLTTYADVDAIVSKTANDNSLNSVDKALTNIYAEAGSSSQLFGTDSNLSLATSITNDMALMMVLARKMARLITSIINNKYGNANISFTYKILPVSFYNQKEYVEEALKLANSGYSFLLPALAMDLSQRELSNVKDLENDVLKLKEKLLPLSTSYTETGNVGRPAKDAQDKSAKTVANEESLDRGGSN
jgi:hypothetical protein